MSLEMVIGMGLIAITLIAMAIGIGNAKEHFAFKLFAYSAAFVLFVLMAKAGIDSTETCVHLINQTTENTTTGLTTNDYTLTCFTNTTYGTADTYYKFILAIFGVFFAYVVFFFVYKLGLISKGFMRRR